MSAFSTRTQIIATLLATLIAGLLGGLWGYCDARNGRLIDVANDARRCSLAIPAADLAALTGTPADEITPAYKRIKTRLTTLNAAHPRVQFISLFREDPRTGALIALADSEPSYSYRLLHPGDPFPGQVNADDVLKTLRTGEITVNLRQSDAAGKWVSVYVLVEGAASERTIMRLDDEISLWRRSLLHKAFERAIFVWLLLGIPAVTFFVSRRQSRQILWLHKLNVAVDQCATPMMIVSGDGTIEYASQGLCALSRFDREELIGEIWIGQSRAAPVENVARVQALAKEGKTWTEDLELERKGGERFPAKVTSTPVRNASGHIVAYIIVLADMTEIRHQAQELRLAKERAEATDHAKGIFLATMGHEVRTPLNGIIGFSDLLLDTELTSEQREYVLAIYTSGEALMHLTSNILDYTRIESGRLQLAADHCDLSNLIEESLDIVAPRAAGKKLELLHEIHPAVPSQIITDGGRLRQVIVNLLGNAIKFTASGEIEISVRLLPYEARASRAPFDAVSNTAGTASAQGKNESQSIKLEFVVRDTGIGIAAEDQAKLFRPFVQLDSSSSRRFEGAGLGLVISYDLVRLMGGNIIVSSEVGKGTLFSFTIRCVADTSMSAPPNHVPRLAGKRVALVVPHEGLRRELQREITHAGAVVENLTLAQLDTYDWDWAVVDCDASLLAFLPQYMSVPERWRGSRMIGLVPIDIEGKERQYLRPFFSALLGKPVRHALLIDRLSREFGSASESEASAQL